MSDVTYTYELGKRIPKDATHVVIPDEIEEIDEHDFLWCQDNLKSVMYKNGEIIENIKDAICMFEYYKGKLGEFYYNPDEFEIWPKRSGETLKYCGKESDGSKIMIPSGLVTADRMFYDCKNLTEPPVIPEGVKDCNSMFKGCTNLTKVPVIPESVKDCAYMFHGCENLKEVPAIPNGVQNCVCMFNGCKNLTEVPAIPNGVQNCVCMFNGCKNLTEAPVIPEGVKSCDCMFIGCSEEVQKAGWWNIKHRGLDYYVDGPGKKSTEREIPGIGVDSNGTDDEIQNTFV